MENPCGEIVGTPTILARVGAGNAVKNHMKSREIRDHIAIRAIIEILILQHPTQG